MKKFLFVTSLCSLVFLLLSAVRDNGILGNLLLKLERLQSERPQEKVHLHFDKPYYSIGDDIWFKAYVVNAEHNELSVLSKVLYVELVDEQDSVRSTTVVPLENGLSDGGINLSDTVFSAGNYQLRAYTRWMQNFDNDLVFQKQIAIGDALNSGNLLASARFAMEDAQQLNAALTFLHLTDKSPVSGKDIFWSLLKGDRLVDKGTTLTGPDGKVSIRTSYKGDPNELLLTATVTPGSSETITRDFPVRVADGQPDLQFFPEGGRMVAGLRSKVAFKAVRPDGSSLTVNGYIADQNDKKVLDFETEHAGMGVFAFLPEKGKIYTAFIKSTKGQTYQYSLPPAELQGHILSINHSGKDSLVINVKATAAMQSTNAVSLIALQNGNVKYLTRIDKGRSSVSFRLPSSRFETGIVQFTLFSADEKPLAERLLFVNNHDHLQLKTSSKPAYGKREKVEMKLSATDYKTTPVQGSFSVSVTNAEHVPYHEDEETTIFSSLLLSSDLRGYIEEPNYYFNHVDAGKIRHLDHLMLTQGWRRFKWSDLQNDQLPQIRFAAQKSLDVSGKITSLNGTPVAGGPVVLLGRTAQGPMFIDTVADDKGNFLVKDLVFNGNAKFVARARNAKGRNNVEILFSNPDALSTLSSVMPAFYAGDDRISDYLQSSKARFDGLVREGGMKRSIRLKEVKITERISVNNKVVKNSFNPGNGFADQVITEDKLKKHSSLINAFYNLPGITVKNGMVYKIPRRSLTGGPLLMKVYANGAELFPDMLKDIPPSDIEGIEILTSASNTMIYDASGSGVILVTFKKGGDFKRPPSTFLDHILVKGYSEAREFYSPNYEDPSVNQKLPDLRSTVYWNPHVVTDPEGKASFSFFTSDEPGTYRVIVEGLTLDGHLGRHTYTFQVK